MCAGECRKTGRILASFVDPRQAFGPDKIIPPQVLANAKVFANCLLLLFDVQADRILEAFLHAIWRKLNTNKQCKDDADESRL